MTWKPYMNERLIKECDGYFIIKPSESSKQTIPLACPVCDMLFRSIDDERSYRLFTCCENCELLWARPNQEKWREGWRPDKKSALEKVKNKKLNVSIEI